MQKLRFKLTAAVLAAVIALCSYGTYVLAQSNTGSTTGGVNSSTTSVMTNLPFRRGYALQPGEALNLMYNNLQNLTNYFYHLVPSGSTSDSFTFDGYHGIVILETTVNGGMITAETISMPARPFDGQFITVVSQGTITTLVVAANTTANSSQALAASTPTVLTASTTVPQAYSWIYRAANSKWYRVQ